MGRGGGDNTLKEVGELKICQNWGGINRQYLGHGTLKNRPTSRAARKENWGVRIRTGSHKKLQICSSREEVLVLTCLFFKIGEWFVACYGKIFLLLYFIWKLLIDNMQAWIFVGLFNLYHAFIDMGNCVLYFDMQVFSFYTNSLNSYYKFGRENGRYTELEISGVE